MATLDEQFISVQIVRLLPFGLLVRLPDGNQGLIREREIGWDRQSRHNWQRRFKPGDTCQALPLGIGLDDRLELSLRLAEHDPWHMLDVRYPVGHLVQGTVTSVQSYGVFVELEPGVSGLLHNSRLPAHLQGQPVEDLFWAGDVVKVLVERIEPRSRQISFNLSRALLQRWPRGQLPARTDEASATLSDTVSHSDADSPPTLRWRILVVEDDSAQRQALARWLEQEGHQVRAAESAEAAFLLLEEMTPDLVLTDFGLPQQNGLTVLRHVRKRWPSLRCALMTDWTRISEHGDEIAHWHRQGVHLLLKPLQPADVEALLVAQPEAPEALPELTEPLEQQRPALPHLLHTNGFRPQFLHDLLAQACSATGAAKAVLFALEPTRRAVRILAEVGVAPLNDEAISGLLHSPVRDVAEDQPLLRIDDSQQAEARLRYLTPLLSFRSCLGLRLPTHLKERHALFLFSPQPHAFNASHELHTSATALAAGAWLERAAFQQQALEVQRLALLGQMSRGLVHEINHQLSPINFI
ncbi:MAG: response regulator, partial [Chloroflexaceae bacterium]|nr:response regulator [Chloroflexaceae bacterium]